MPHDRFFTLREAATCCGRLFVQRNEDGNSTNGFGEEESSNLPIVPEEREFEIDEQLARFKIWVGSLGVLASGRASADERLKNDPDIKDVILNLLHRLARRLERSDQFEPEPEPPTESEDEGDDNSIGESISSLESDEDGEILEGTQRSQESTYCSSNITEIADLITRLFRFSTFIRKSGSAKDDQRASRWAERKARQLDDEFQELENHVRWQLQFRYPKIVESFPVLEARIIHTILQRRRRLLYRVNHQRKLESGAIDLLNQQNIEPVIEGSQRQPDTQADRQPAHNPATVPGSSTTQERNEARKAVTFADTVPTTATNLDRSGFSTCERSTILSMISPSITAGLAHLDVPSPPKAFGPEVLCPYCSRILGSEIKEKGCSARWKQHLLRDIEPYICLFNECATPGEQFRSKEEWIHHMGWQHARIWSCPAADHRDQAFASPESLKEHFMAQHPHETEQSLDLYIEKATKISPDALAAYATSNGMTDSEGRKGACPFCDDPSMSFDILEQGIHATFQEDESKKRVESHIARHLEVLALLSLPAREESTSHTESISHVESTSHAESTSHTESISHVESTSHAESTPHADAPTTSSEARKICFYYRQELLKIQVYLSSETHSNSFFPEPKMRKLFTENAISDILACTCESCNEDSRAMLGDFAESEHNYISEIAQDYVSSFALLVLIRHTKLIHYFPWKERKDSQLEGWIGKRPEEFLKEVWPGYEGYYEEIAINTAREFLRELPRFSVPKLSNSSYVKWSKERILPFIEKEDLSSDSEARIVAFTIAEGYQNFKDLNVREFVRKEISVKEADLFVTYATYEKVALQMVRKLDHPHIVRMIKTYSLGETFNIIFPRAETNLEAFLRDPKYSGQVHCDSRSHSESFWDQMIGIAHALSNVHNVGEEAEKLEDPKVGMSHVDKWLIGCHFDLKPANILVDKGGKCFITDFGQSVFKAVESGRSSDIHSMPGTAVYAAPRKESEKPNRRFDIWSFGCILLEVATFWVRGREGVEELDKVRVTDSHEAHVGKDLSFHARDPNTGEFILKPEVDDFMESLPERLEVEEAIKERTETFLNRLLELIRKMLEPKSADRPSAREVYRDLKDSRDAYMAAVNLLDAASTQSSSTDERELRRISKDGIWLKWENEWKAITVNIRPVPQGLHFENRLRYGSSDRLYFAGKDHYLVPLYCFKPFDMSGRAAWISLTSAVDMTMEYAFKSRSNAKSYQALVTRHELYEVFDLEDVNIIPHFTTGKTLTRAARKGMAKAESLPLFKNYFQTKSIEPDPLKWKNNAASIQIWKETQAKSSESGSSSSGTMLETGVPDRRIVIYGAGVEGRSIAIIKFHQNFKIDKDKDIWDEENGPQNEGESGDPLVSFVPRDKSRDEKFSMTIIHPSRDSEGKPGFAAIPIYPEALGKYENENRIYCKEISLKFTSSENRKKFSQQYLWRYQKWSNERKGIPGYGDV